MSHHQKILEPVASLAPQGYQVQALLPGTCIYWMDDPLHMVFGTPLHCSLASGNIPCNAQRLPPWSLQAAVPLEPLLHTNTACPAQSLCNWPTMYACCPCVFAGEDVKTALKLTAEEYVASGKEAKSTLSALSKLPFMKRDKPVDMTLDQLVTALFFAGLAFQLAFWWLLGPGVLGTLFYGTVGLVMGLALSFVYYANARRKKINNQMVRHGLYMCHMHNNEIRTHACISATIARGRAPKDVLQAGK